MAVFTVYVDDNFHYMDESERRKHGKFETFEEAVAACKAIVGQCLQDGYAKDMTADELISQYVQFGDDPWISGDYQPYHFSARDYARVRVNEICGS